MKQPSLIVKWTIGTILLVVLAASFVPGCNDEPPPSTRPVYTPPPTLTIVTPHNEIIRQAFENGFANWYLAKNKSSIEIRWLAMGTPQCVQYVKDVFTRHGEDRPHVIPDLVFGAGVSDHQQFASAGYARPIKLGEAVASVPAHVASCPTRDPDGRWYATGMSSFGILYNDKACQQRGIPPPATWSDLADPRFRSWIAVADPAMSGSHRRCMAIILQQRGWKDGWPTILRILANCRGISGRSADAINQVRAGNCLATFAVNFDGLEAAAESGGQLKYVNPAGATLMEPDIITILNCAPHPDIAEQFLRFCLSEQGQSLWGVRHDGPRQRGVTLHHYPIVPSIYDKFADRLAVPENPLKSDFGVKFDAAGSEKIIAVLEPLVHAVCGDNHVLLQQAWDAAVASGLPAPLTAELTALPFDAGKLDQTTAICTRPGTDEYRKLGQSWAADFATRFKTIVSNARPSGH